MPKRKSRAEKPGPDEALEEPASEPLESEELVETLRAELEEAIEARKRALADFANFQRRAGENEQRAREDGAADVVRSLLAVIDHFDLALGQDTSQMTVEQLLGGVRIVRDELVKALETRGVFRLEPEPGDEFDPNRHEAMMHTPARDIEPNHIVSLLQPGYTLGTRILRPAKVAVASPAAESGEPADEEV